MVKSKFFAVLVLLASLAYAEQGEVVDSRDGKSYFTVEMGGLTWFGANLDFEMPGSYSYCDSNPNESCDGKGRLYTFDAAQKACPEGWRLPTEKETKRMLNDTNSVLVRDFLPRAGGLRSEKGEFMSIEEYGYYWTSTASSTGAKYFYWKSSDFSTKFLSGKKSSALSVRCVKK